MGIKFTCPACGGALNVKSELAGKRGRCPKCQAKIAIPADGASSGSDSEGSGQSAAATQVAALASAPAMVADPSSAAGAAQAGAPSGALLSAQEQPAVPGAPQPAVTTAPASAVDAISEAPTLQWYAAPPGAASQYGPASGQEFRVWMQEGRITADALVWRQDWADWKRAGTVFPELDAPAAAGALPVAPLAPSTATPLPTAVAAMPLAAGGPPVALPAFPVAGAVPGVVPTAAPIASDAFPITADDSTPTRSAAGRGRGYRQRSNAGPILAIVVLLVAMIPLSYFVWKVVSEQLGTIPPTETATGANGSKE